MRIEVPDNTVCHVVQRQIFGGGRHRQSNIQWRLESLRGVELLV
jgi:hypothetical protein